MKNFDSDFESERRFHRTWFRAILGTVVAIFVASSLTAIAIFGLISFLGYKLYKAPVVQEFLEGEQDVVPDNSNTNAD